MKRRFHEFWISLKLGKKIQKTFILFYIKQYWRTQKQKQVWKCLSQRSRWLMKDQIGNRNRNFCYFRTTVFLVFDWTKYFVITIVRFMKNTLRIDYVLIMRKVDLLQTKVINRHLVFFFHWLQLWLPHCSLIFLQSRQYLIEFIQTFVQKKTISKF